MTKAQAHPAEFKGTDLKSEKDFFLPILFILCSSEIANRRKVLFYKDFYVAIGETRHLN